MKIVGKQKSRLVINLNISEKIEILNKTHGSFINITFIILFCSLSVQRWSGLKIVLRQEQPKGEKSGNK